MRETVSPERARTRRAKVLVAAEWANDMIVDRRLKSARAELGDTRGKLLQDLSRDLRLRQFRIAPIMHDRDALRAGERATEAACDPADNGGEQRGGAQPFAEADVPRVDVVEFRLRDPARELRKRWREDGRRQRGNARRRRATRQGNGHF